MSQFPDIGDRAPAFDLPSTDGLVSLNEQLMKGPVLLIFYPPDDSTAAARLLGSYRDQISLFEEMGVTVLAINSDGVDSHQTLANRQKLPFPLLSDADGEVAKTYGAIHEKRLLVVVGDDGRVWIRDSGTRLFGPRPADVGEMIAQIWS
jgi:peroxiredoxin Q/BCP